MGYNNILVIICLGEKEISPKVLKISQRILMITFGVSHRGHCLLGFPLSSRRENPSCVNSEGCNFAVTI